MVSPLKYFKADPNNKGRGRGFYYRRISYKRGWFSKFSSARDGVHKIKGKAHPKLGRRYEHAGDRKKVKSMGVFKPTARAKPKKMFGWF